MLNNLFQVYYLICLIVASFIRVWYGRKYRQDRKAILREEGFAYALLASLWGGDYTNSNCAYVYSMVKFCRL